MPSESELNAFLHTALRTRYERIITQYRIQPYQPKLMNLFSVPDKFAPTLPTRDWLINPLGGNPVWTPVIAVVPALLGNNRPGVLYNRLSGRY